MYSGNNSLPAAFWLLLNLTETTTIKKLNQQAERSIRRFDLQACYWHYSSLSSLSILPYEDVECEWPGLSASE